MVDPANNLAAFHCTTGVPVALDETVDDAFRAALATGTSIEKSLAEYFEPTLGVSALVLKPSVLGGLEACAAAAQAARSRGVAAVVTTAFESGVGVAACSNLARALDAAAMDAAPAPLAAVRVVLPNPLSRELFVTALRSVAAVSGPAGTDDALQASDAADAEPESAECLDGVDRARGAALDAWVGHVGGGAAQRRLAEVLDECVPRGDTYGLYVVGQSVPNPAAAERAERSRWTRSDRMPWRSCRVARAPSSS